MSTSEPLNSTPVDAPSGDPLPVETPASNPVLRGLYDGTIIALAVWLGLLTATAEAFLTPFRLFGVLIPISVLAAAVITPALAIVSFRLTERRGLSLLPAAAWTLGALFWSQGTDEGDVVLAGDSWVAVAYLLVGSIAAGFGAYRVMLSRVARPVRTLEPPADLGL